MELYEKLMELFYDVSDKFDIYQNYLKQLKAEGNLDRQAIIQSQIEEARRLWHQSMTEFNSLAKQVLDSIRRK